MSEREHGVESLRRRRSSRGGFGIDPLSQCNANCGSEIGDVVKGGVNGISIPSVGSGDWSGQNLATNPVIEAR